MNNINNKSCSVPDAFEVRGWGSSDSLSFILEPGYKLGKYKDLLDEQIKRISTSIYDLKLTGEKETSAVSPSDLEVARVKGNGVSTSRIGNKDSNEQELYFSSPSVLVEAKEGNKYISSINNKLDMSKRIVLHAIKIVGLSFLAVIRKILLIPFFKKYLAPVFGLKNNINGELEKALNSADVVYADSISWVLSHFLYLRCEIIFSRKINVNNDPANYRNVPFTVRAALQKNAGSSSEVNRVIVHDNLSDDGYTLKAIKGLLNEQDVIILYCDVLPVEVSNWDRSTEVEQGVFLCEGVPDAWKRNYIPIEPVGGWPKISVITVSYNQADFIEDCLNSILDQGYPNLEYIVVDGKSTDGSIDILNSYRNRINHLIIEPDSGQSNALNKGFNLATGEIMTWICSDDMLIDGALFHIGKAYAENKVDMIVGGCKIISENGELIHHHHTAIPLEKPFLLSFSDMLDFMGSWHRGQYFYQPEVFFSKNIWHLSGGFLKEHLYYAMDYDMFLRMGMAGAEIFHIPKVIGVSRQHSKQKTQYSTKAYLPQIKMIMEEYLEMVNTTISTVNQDS